ncbi:hypothetical protein SNEBB_010560 [Seison nebaliae]|nr:hypothetical protein SNEBB_010560 [Seison nebaliae]
MPTFQGMFNQISQKKERRKRWPEEKPYRTRQRMGNRNSINQHLDYAKKVGVCNLANIDLQEFPVVLYSLNNIRTLDYSNHEWRELDDRIMNWPLMKSITANNCHMLSVSSSIGELKKLETLSLHHNQLKKLPKNMVNLRLLRSIDISYNSFENFPMALISKMMKNLDTINISFNRLGQLPEAVGECTAKEINCNNNRIDMISSELSKCNRLKILRVDNNRLDAKSIPSSILKESNISLLSLEGMKIDMRTLREIDGYQDYMERFTAMKKKL